MSKSKRKGVGLLVALVAILAMAFSASSASAACPTSILCDGGGNPLRDDFSNAPTFKGYGADILATNTQSKLRLIALDGGKPEFANENDPNYAYFGLELMSNPASSSEACNDAEGWVTFADVQKASPSPVYAGISPTRFGPWPFVVYSDQGVCGEDAGRVVIENVHLFFQLIGGTAVGTFTGAYEQPGANCEGGGVKLDGPQPGVTVRAGELTLDAAVDDGAGGAAYICFVSSNNVLYPEAGPTWTPLVGSIEQD